MDGALASGSCCGVGGTATPVGDRWAADLGKGLARVDLLVPGITCAACMSRIERGMSGAPGIEAARVNLSTKRVAVTIRSDETDSTGVVAALDALGYEAKPFDAAAMAGIDRDGGGRDLLARLGVAGFAAMNVMLLSVSVWSGAEGATRDLLHWVSALIALPAIAFAGMPFYRSGAAALAQGRLNMDVPISLAVFLAAGTSLYETLLSGPHAYFDAAISLLFFLLIGRYLDHRTRAVARSAAAELTALSAHAAMLIEADGTRLTVPIDAVQPGHRLAVAPGERIPADGVVALGTSDLDRSMVTGESAPEPVAPKAEVHAGMLNLSGPLEITVTATGEKTLLAEIAQMVEAAERGQTRYDAWADQAAKLYAPGVHIISALAFLGWIFATGDWRLSITIAAAVLIITCPCALGLAVPAVHAVSGGTLFRRGVFLKDGTVLERLARVDTVVFDKTGTLTLGQPVLSDAPDDARVWSVAAALARESRHPLSRAIADEAAGRGVVPANVTDIVETPGAGVSAEFEGQTVRLGRADWCGVPAEAGVFLLLDDEPFRFAFTDRLREDAADTVAALKFRGLSVVLLSGDAAGPVAEVAEATGIDDARAAMTPAGKLEALNALAAEGRRVLMVGDGINDAPSLAAAEASMSPVAAADVSRAAAGLVFTGPHLEPVVLAVDIARAARSRALENFALATIYNVISVPLAIAGFVTPLLAALAMSASSIVVTLNALRIRYTR